MNKTELIAKVAEKQGVSKKKELPVSKKSLTLFQRH